MPSFEVDANERRKAEEIVQFVRNFMGDLSVEGRFVLALELMRLMKPDLDELKRRQADVVIGGSDAVG
jgi:hypothetical protein